MKKILEIFNNDIKNILKSKMAILIIVGIMIIPGIYSWLNIDSNWGPYDNTGNLPIAIVNNDDGVTLMGEEVSIGDEIEHNLKDNKDMKWIFTTEKEAKTKVKQGKYYGAIIIPKDFSEKVTTLFEEGKPIKPRFDFYVNNKKNSIAPIIINKAVGTIQNSVNQAFIKEIVYKFVDKAENLDIALKSKDATNETIEKLEKAKGQIVQLRTIVRTTDLAADSTKKSLLSIRELLPKMSDISNTTKKDITDMKGAAKSIALASDTIEKDVSSLVDVAEADMKEIHDSINKLNAVNLINNSSEITGKIDKTLVVLKRLQSTLGTINNLFNLKGINALESKASNQIKKLENIKNTLSNTTEAVNKIDDIKKDSNDAFKSASELKKQYNGKVKTELNSLYKTTSDSISNVTDSILNLNVSFDNVDNAMGYMISALGNGSELTGNINTLLIGFEGDIDNLISLIKQTRDSELFNNAINLLKNKPEEVADFLTSPIESNEIDLYPIKEYGSKMTPFYSILACWVGCTLLTAILKIGVDKKQITKDANHKQLFFGRFMLFGGIAMIQGLVIGLGDLFLGVETYNALAFLVTLMLSSLTFMLIIYSLASAFGKIGQALAIILLVLQVAGSGGTFPVELLPRGFQLIQPFMPFTPAMNAARETIGGFYEADYFIYLLVLICHMAIALLLGLVFGKLTVKTKERLEKELHKTGVIE